MAPAQLRLGVVDDHPVYRSGLANVLQQSSRAISVRWTAGSVDEAVQHQDREPVDAILLDYYAQAGLSGAAAVRAVHARHPQVRVIVMSGLAGDDGAAQVVTAGASGFVHKSMPVPDMIAAILQLLGATEARREAARTRAREVQLTRREREVLGLIRQGRTNREISEHLGISVATVNKHVHNLLIRLGAPNRSAAAQRPIGWDLRDASPGRS